MRKWLLAQAMALFPPLTFCLIALGASVLAPAEKDDGAALTTTAHGVRLVRRHEDGRVFTLRTSELTRHADDSVVIADVSLRLSQGDGELILRGDGAFVDAARENLTMPAATGALTTPSARATLSARRLAYRMADGRIAGEAAVFSDAAGELRGDRLTIFANGDVVISGNARGRYAGE